MMTKKLGNLFLLGPLALLGILQVNSAQGAILFESSNNIKQVDNFWYKNESADDPWFDAVTNSPDSFFGFNETQNLTLTDNLAIQESPYFGDLLTTNTVIEQSLSPNENNIQNLWDDLQLTTFIEAGTTLSSHMVYIAPNTRKREFITSRVVFDQPIIGFFGDFDLFRTADNDLFAPNTVFPGPKQKNSLEGSQPGWAVNEGVNDLVTFVDPYTIDLAFTSYGFESFRVLTLGQSSGSVPEPTIGDNPVSAPEPTTILGTGIFLGFATLFKRKSLKSKRVST